jgi:hypothetical protein
MERRYEDIGCGKRFYETAVVDPSKEQSLSDGSMEEEGSGKAKKTQFRTESNS